MLKCVLNLLSKRMLQNCMYYFVYKYSCMYNTREKTKIMYSKTQTAIISGCRDYVRILFPLYISVFCAAL